MIDVKSTSNYTPKTEVKSMHENDLAGVPSRPQGFKSPPVENASEYVTKAKHAMQLDSVPEL